MKVTQRILLLILMGCLPLQGCGNSSNTKSMEHSTQDSTSLLKAVSERNVERVAEILKSQPDLEVKDHKGRTPLMLATYNNDNAIAEMLMASGADVNAQDNMLNSPHLYAGASGNLAILKMTLSHGARFDIYNRYGGTALIPAAEKRHLEVVKLLTEVPKYPIDHINNLGWTALMEAIVLGTTGETQIAIVDMLIKAGADVNIPDNDGITPLQHAKKGGMNTIAQLLIAANAHD
ncbi:ankyrin repeat domain-containing protein [uncultured Gelidibacter sp.]|uniref:ankyrin repeat domain-containing protein n=1 Tax=uncultured Gelidibacter sp. TaxID=259318 RepID=UPI002610F51D|nr:ankyrin repeat domain-containing protein [uncultured Gelidibacter sp.]